MIGWIYISLGFRCFSLLVYFHPFQISPHSFIRDLFHWWSNSDSFFLPALSASNSQPLLNEILFKTETLSPGKHELIAIYEGNSGAAPLALDYFIVQNGTSSSSTSSNVPSSSTPSPSFPSSGSFNSTSNLGSKKSHLVGIVVGVAGGVIVLVLLLLLFHIRRDRKSVV